METAELVEGRSYGYREKRSKAAPLLRVTLLEKLGRRGKVKIRFDDGPYPGLEDYANTRQLVIPWAQHKKLLRDEERAVRLEEYARTVADGALAAAACAVLTSTGEPEAWAEPTTTAIPEAQLQRICDRAGITSEPMDLHSLAYTDRHGYVQLPLDAVVTLARAFAAAEPMTVVEYIDDYEEELRLKGNVPGDRWYHDYLRQKGPGHALARRWAGLEAESDSLRREVGRLRALVSAAADQLKAAGKEGEALRLQRALDGR